ncbi:M55 family metallopeptidase [Pantoea ananatis]|uniref:M55 family metallopeptidase n=1 Tax=Pantoea ananas TaxID=553 RepID=UPI00221E8115|nr:M55 family metallopeptidase [Pantoea ananatis]
MPPAAAEQGTPLLLVTGDDQLQSWIAEYYYPTVDYVCVKRAISHTCAESISPKAAQRAICAAASAALQHPHQASTTRLAAPYRMQLQASKPVLADLFSLIPGVTRIDAVTVEYQAERMGTLISLLSAFSYLASTQSS